MATSRKKPESKTKAGRRLALLICNGSFSNIPDYHLLGPAKDAQHFAAVLADPDTCRFEVRTLVDGGLLEVRLAIAQICASADEADTLLVYYSGNGIVDDSGSLHLLVSDSVREFPYATALDSEFILSQLRASKCRNSVLLIDACYAGAFFTHNRGIPNGLYAITSCGAQERCADTPDGGAFTVALCEGLRKGSADADGDGKVSVDELHEFVKQKLLKGKNEGTPQKWVWNVPAPIHLSSVPRHIFLSYAREDMQSVDRLAEGLEAQGLVVWIDREGIQSGNWKERVTESLLGSRAVVLLLTKSSLKSEAVQKELKFAAIKKVPIVPVHVGKFKEADLPNWYTLDFSELHRHQLDTERYAEGLKKLVNALQSLRRVPAR